MGPVVPALERAVDEVTRPRHATVIASLSGLLVLTALTGVALVGIGRDDTRPAGTTTARATELPLRIPGVEVTMVARPAATAPASPAATPGARRADRRPSSTQRDDELAAWLAASGTGDQTAPLPMTGFAALPTPSSYTTFDPSVDTSPDTALDPALDTAGLPAVTAPVPAAVPVPAPTSATPGTTSDASARFRLSSFNVLGSSHTRNGARGRAPGVVRIHGAAQLLARHDVDVVGFQELQSDQARELVRATGGAYSLYPGAGPGKDSENSIGWRSAQWQLVQATTESIPYFNGHHRRMPVVLLRHRASGIEAWFGNFHNPAETSQYHHQQRWRTEATRLEAALANRLQASGVPLFITGDMNERAPYFCRLTGAAPSMRAARGGSNGAGGCRVGKPRAVDWILGSQGVVFSGYDEDRTDLVDRTTDHPVISTGVRIDASVFPRAATAAR